jgi:hypothetical protein
MVKVGVNEPNVQMWWFGCLPRRWLLNRVLPRDSRTAAYPPRHIPARFARHDAVGSEAALRWRRGDRT